MTTAVPAFPPSAIPPRLVTHVSNAMLAQPAPSYPPLQPSKHPGDDFFNPAKVVRPKKDDPEEQEVVAELRRNVTEFQSAEGEFLANAERELDFLAGEQWLDETTGQDTAKLLRADGRSAFTIDLLTPSVDIVVNGIRINKTSISFVPVSEGANVATATMRSGLYRNIERQSRAAIARETAYSLAVSVGRGYYRVVIEDEDGATFNRRISIKRIDNLNSVAIDPTCTDFNYADSGWAYCYEPMWKNQFEAEYGEDPSGQPFDLDTLGLLLNDKQRSFWFPKDKIIVGEYFRRRWKKREVWRLADGTDCWKEDAPPGATPVRVKPKLDPYLEWRKMTGTQTLEKRIWPGKLIPIVVVIGREIFRGSKPKINSGMVKAAMAPSQINNYMTSRMVDEVGLSPLPHMMSAVGQLSPEQKQIVNSINKHPWSNVEYSLIEDEAGRAVPAPGWVSPSPNTAAVVQAATSAKDSLMRVLNTFAPQLGALQAQQSGTAVAQVKEQGDISHAAFPDNYNRALLYEAEIVNELMDQVYTEKQAVTIVEPDETTTNVLINQEYLDKKTGQKITHLFGGDAKYGVVPQTMAAYPTRMAEGVQRILDLIKSMAPPEIVKILDLVVKDLNIPNSQKYADRLRPPGFQDPDEGPSNIQLQQQVQASQQVLDQAHGLIQQLLLKVQELGDKRSIELLQIASKERIAAAGDMAGILEAEFKAKLDANNSVLMTEMEAILKQLQGALDVKQLQASTAAQASAQPDQSASPTPAPASPAPAGTPAPQTSPAPPDSQPAGGPGGGLGQ